MNRPTWIRVTRQNPCRICSRGDWCTVSEIGSACCRVESDRPLKNGSWLHKFDGPVPKLPRREKTPTLSALLDAQSLIEKWRLSTNGEIDQLARDLTVSARSLLDLGTVWAAPHRAYGFPMTNQDGVVTGIRLRATDGKKWAVKNSKAGVFFPTGAMIRLSTTRVFICEGPTDTAALLSIGLFAIGRPSCLGCEQIVCDLLRNLGTREAVLITDNDAPGLRGAEKLQTALRVRTAFLVPPAKDARAFVAAGGTAQLLESMLNNCIWK